MAGWWSAAAAHRNGIPRPIQLQGRLVICASDRQSRAFSPNSLPVDMVLGEAETETETETERDRDRETSGHRLSALSAWPTQKMTRQMTVIGCSSRSGIRFRHDTFKNRPSHHSPPTMVGSPRLSLSMELDEHDVLWIHWGGRDRIEIKQERWKRRYT